MLNEHVKFQEFMTSNDVLHQTSHPHTQQNGVEEPKNKYVTEITRTVLHSHVPHLFRGMLS